jgi:hypothetical protein
MRILNTYTHSIRDPSTNALRARQCGRRRGQQKINFRPLANALPDAPDFHIDLRYFHYSQRRNFENLPSKKQTEERCRCLPVVVLVVLQSFSKLRRTEPLKLHVVTANSTISLNLAPVGMQLTLTYPKGQNPHQYDLSNQDNFTQGLDTNDDNNAAQAAANVSILAARVVSAEDRVDPAGSYYTAYVMRVESSCSDKSSRSLGNDGPGATSYTDSININVRTTVVEHRYSEFARLHAELSANNVTLRSSFPTKSICGRLGNWTPAAHWAPDKMAELVTYRKIKLDLWIIELTELLSRNTKINEHVRTLCLEFFQKPAGCPPCERANPVHWAKILSLEPSSKSSEIFPASLADEVSLNARPFAFPSFYF